MMIKIIILRSSVRHPCCGVIFLLSCCERQCAGLYEKEKRWTLFFIVDYVEPRGIYRWSWKEVASNIVGAANPNKRLHPHFMWMGRRKIKQNDVENSRYVGRGPGSSLCNEVIMRPTSRCFTSSLAVNKTLKYKEAQGSVFFSHFEFHHCIFCCLHWKYVRSILLPAEFYLSLSIRAVWLRRGTGQPKLPYTV